LLDDGLSESHGSPPKPVVTLCLQVVDLLGCGLGGLPVAGDAAWQNELAGLLGIGHDDAQPDDYCTAVGVFSGFHGVPRLIHRFCVAGGGWIGGIRRQR